MKKKWQARFMAAATALGFVDKVKAGSLTADDQKLIFAEYEKTHSISFNDDKLLNEDVDVIEQTLLSVDEQTQLASMLGVSVESAPKSKGAAFVELGKKVVEQKASIETLENEPEQMKVPKVTAQTDERRILAVALGNASHSASHLFGIESPRYARSAWHNELFVTRQPRGNSLSEDEKNSLITDFKAFMGDVRNRVSNLTSNNSIGLLNYGQMIAGQSNIDYTDIEANAPEYSVRRTDLILAFFRNLPSVANIFPVVSNIQNKEIAPTANFGELSQGYRSGRIFKGNVKFAAEIYSVVDLMFKFKFSDMIKLEKMYIGYMNREGSNVMKWTFMEWLLVYFGQILINEQQRRRVCGVAVPAQNVVANPSQFGADGILRAIERTEEDFKILPFEDLGTYDNNSILTVFEEMWDKVSLIVPSMDGFKLYANAKHKQWYVRNYRAKYALNEDFVGSTGNVLVDLSVDSIVWVPNMPVNCFKLWITIPNNIENYEDKPMEMLGFYFQQDMEDMLTMSRWKEGSGVLRAGVQYKTKAELVAAGRELQWIFTNFPATDLALASTVSLKDNTLFEITGNTEVDTVTGYSHEMVYKLVATSSFATTKVKKAGVFAKITSDFQPAAAGDYIKVYAELADETDIIDGQSVLVTKPTGNFLELSRSVTV